MNCRASPPARRAGHGIGPTRGYPRIVHRRSRTSRRPRRSLDPVSARPARDGQGDPVPGPCVGLGWAGAYIAHYFAGPWGFTSLRFDYVPTPFRAALAHGTFRRLPWISRGRRARVGGADRWIVGIRERSDGAWRCAPDGGRGGVPGVIDPTLAFFGAAFVGLVWAILGAVSGGRIRRAMPYGPFLAIATVLVLLTRPLIGDGLSGLFGYQIKIP